ncbi:MAG: T9SS type A sorting domain-containing protein [Bacteroidia bacterium]|nr:T9SS type A sorting domain-containing protein [Bacteroidia bacterium]
MLKINSLFLLLLCLCQFSWSQTSKSALFLGNSYTYVNNLPQLVADIATSKGDTLDHDSNAPGGYTLQGHSTNATSLTKINSRPWDYVVLQEQSQLPSFPPNQVASDVYPYADSLHKKIQANDSCTTSLFYMTWGRKNGDQANCANYAPLCTYAGMQARLRTSYLYMGQKYGEVAPAGAAWKLTRDQNPGIELYQADESHPSLAGSYLVACVFYASMFAKSPVGAYIPAGLNSTDAAILQENARKVVLDSLDNWFMDTAAVAAAFTQVQSNPLEITFSNTSAHAKTWHWDFGDGNTSSSASPVHTYTTDGTYIVQLVAYRGCLSDTARDTLTVSSTGFLEVKENQDFQIFPNPAQNLVTVRLPRQSQNLTLKDLQGREIAVWKAQSREMHLSLSQIPKGIYLLQVTTREGIFTRKLIKI